jgi:hypothetical protein
MKTIFYIFSLFKSFSIFYAHFEELSSLFTYSRWETVTDDDNI